MRQRSQHFPKPYEATTSAAVIRAGIPADRGDALTGERIPLILAAQESHHG
jgi:hypothetical protein